MGNMEQTAQYLHTKQALDWLKKDGRTVSFKVAAPRVKAPRATPAAERATGRVIWGGPVLVGPAVVAQMADRLSVPTDRLLAITAISERTYVRRKKDRKDLTETESDRLLRVARVAAEAERVFGDEAKSSKWLNTFSVMLDAKPLDLLASDGGSRAVEDELVRIEFGDFT